MSGSWDIRVSDEAFWDKNEFDPKWGKMEIQQIHLKITPFYMDLKRSENNGASQNQKDVEQNSTVLMWSTIH